MNLDQNAEIVFNPEQRTVVKKNLPGAAQQLYGGACTSITVPDYDFGRALIRDNDSPLMELIREFTDQYGVNKLKSPEVSFLVADFTKFRDPKEVLTELMAQIPRIHEADPSRPNSSFGDFYPGKVITIIGPEMIPHGFNASDLIMIARRAPTAFIEKAGIDKSRGNPQVKEAIGGYIDRAYFAADNMPSF